MAPRTRCSIPALGLAVFTALAITPRGAHAQGTPLALPDACVPAAATASAQACPGLPAPTDEELVRVGDELWRDEASRRGAAATRQPTDLSPRALTAAEAAWLRTASAAICAQSLPPEPMLTLRYRRAYVYYRANHFEEASALFADIVGDGALARDPEGLIRLSADLLLDSLDVLGNRSAVPRPACVDAVGVTVAEIRGLLCAPGDRSEFCDRMLQLRCYAARRNAESLSAAGRMAEAGAAYAALLHDAADCWRVGGIHPDEVLYNAALAFDAAGQPDDALRAREALGRGFSGRSPWVVVASFTQGEQWLERGERARAAEWFERCAAAARSPQLDPTSRGEEALRRALELREALGDTVAVRRDRARLQALQSRRLRP